MFYKKYYQKSKTNFLYSFLLSFFVCSTISSFIRPSVQSVFKNIISVLVIWHHFFNKGIRRVYLFKRRFLWVCINEAYFFPLNMFRGINKQRDMVFFNGQINFPFRVSKGLVITGCHYLEEKRRFWIMTQVGFINGTVEEIFITNTPGYTYCRYPVVL